ncbi:MAG: FG-GAP-like repeat-containing protein [Pirellulaceae bacterium]|jgi:tetratricopeptide (TPR) repeat protein
MDIMIMSSHKRTKRDARDMLRAEAKTAGHRSVLPPQSPKRFWLWLLMGGVCIGCTVLGLAVVNWKNREPRELRSNVASAIRAATQGRLTSSEPVLRQALELDPSNEELLRAYASGLLQAERLDDALEVLDQWCAAHSATAEPFRLRMGVYHAQAQQLIPSDAQDRLKQQALKDGLRVLELAPQDAAIAQNVALLLLATSRFDEADAVCRSQLQRSPNDPTWLFLQARASHSLGEPAEALTLLDKLLAMRPQYQPGLLLKAIVHYEADEAPQAIKLLRTILASESTPPAEVRYYLGLALSRVGQVDEANRLLAEVQRDNFERDTRAMDSQAVRIRRAELLYDCGSAQPAIELLNAVLRDDPQSIAAHRLLADYYRQTGQTAQADKHQSLAAASVVTPMWPDAPPSESASASHSTWLSPSPQLSPSTSPSSNPAELPSSPLSEIITDGGASGHFGTPQFVDITTASGIDFRHFDPATPQNNILETMGSGLGWIDYDGDGLLDLFCIQAGPLPGAPGPTPLPTSRLYRNNGDRTFRDVTQAAGLDQARFGMGCAVGDFDNDGFDDLVLTYWGGVSLYHNVADGDAHRKFVDISADSGIYNPHWATSCGWGDIDGDGDLDLYVCNYVEVDLQRYPLCEHPTLKVKFSCPPWSFDAVTHRLYRNDGECKFTDVSHDAGIDAVSAAPGLGVVLTDLDDDGRVDIYVANDLRPAYLFHNQGAGRFVEQAVLSGCGLNGSGEAFAGMGVDAADVCGTGFPSLFVTNFHFKQNLLFRNEGNLLFNYWTHRSGLGTPSVGRLGFGAVFCDVDLDGQLDLAVANGHVERTAPTIYDAPYAQRAQLFIAHSAGKFDDVSAMLSGYFNEERVGRGVAWGDFDNDGRPDLAFSHCGGPIALLHNRTQTESAWLSLELVGDGQKSNRNAIGAKVEIVASNGKQTRFINGGGSYLSASDRRLLVGLGKDTQAERVVVHWPSGGLDTWLQLPAGQRWRLAEGQSAPQPLD